MNYMFQGVSCLYWRFRISSKKNENKQLLAQINKAFDDCPDSEEEMLENKMRNKQFNNLERESW